MYWTGYLYRYWAYHSLDPEQAIERIKEAKGLTEENQIKRGVEILRRIRARSAGQEQQGKSKKE